MSKKSIIILASSVIGILVILLLCLWLITVLKPTTYTYEQTEDKIIKASERYIKEHPEAMPTKDGIYSLPYSNLVAGEYIKPLNEIVRNDSSCTVNIIVNKKDTNYSVVPYLTCGDNYVTRELYKQILNDNEVVTSGSGLYRSTNGEYYFRGKVKNNYVSFGTTVNKNKTYDTIWRIISIDSNNNVKLKQVSSNIKTSWDDRFNTTRKTYAGYNTFDDSILSETLADLYENNTIFNDNEKSKLVGERLCIGKRTLTDTTKDGSIECSVKSVKEYYLSTILPYEYMRASLDDKCKTLDNKDCSNFNFLTELNHEEEWILTADTETDHQAYVFRGNYFNLDSAKSKKHLYPVIKLNNYAFYKDGDGTEANPYKLKLPSSK